MFTATANARPVPPTSVETSSVGKHHCRLGSVGKTKRRLRDTREASLRLMYVSVSLVCLLSFPLSPFFSVCWRMFIGFRSSP